MLSAGLYIHVPFCDIKCGYCDFYTVTRRNSKIPAYLQALNQEIIIYADDPVVNELQFGSIFLGGGTPSLLSADQIASLLKFIQKKFKVLENAEVTLETNPGTVNLEKLRSLLQAGVNRLSLGVQSFDAAELEFLDRDHSAEQSISAIREARKAGFENISIDLIFGLPGRKPATWKSNLMKAVALNPEHISTYNLTYEDGTILAKRLRRGEISKLNDEIQNDMLLLAIDLLGKSGYQHYEISNYARPGFQSQHNKKYWNGSPYLGLGVSAHSYLNKRRFWNVRNMRKYIDILTCPKELPIEGEERLSLNQRALERVYLGFRQKSGLHLQSFESEIGFSFFKKYPSQAWKFFNRNYIDDNMIFELTGGNTAIESEYLKIENGYLSLTRKGVVLCDEICGEFA